METTYFPKQRDDICRFLCEDCVKCPSGIIPDASAQL